VKKAQDPIFSRNPLDPQKAGALAQALVFELQDEDDIARLLLLCHALTFEPDMTAREGMLNEIEKEAGPMLREVDNTLTAIKRRQYEILKGGTR
jgi:hypothetical protein